MSLLLLAPSSLYAAEMPPALAPAESMAKIVLPEGLKVELVAAEPEIVDPVAMRFDEDGRLWVAEYRDYPLGPPDGGEPLSRVKVLDDKDGDGRYETAHLFADKIPFLNGIQPWKGGIFVTSLGAIRYLKDTDGDDRADVDETWFTGFSEQNSQLFVNHPRLALDGWIYVSSGLRGGEVKNLKHPDAPLINLRSNDLRFDPHTGKAEAAAGRGQFGNTFDDWGNRFICSNRNPLMHVVIAEKYLKRNPNLTVTKTTEDVVAPDDKTKLYPLVQGWTNFAQHEGQFTAACGIDIYRGTALPKEYYGNAFTCEPTGSLIHREILEPKGATFVGHPAYEGREFFASTDPWTRPVNVELGPDGAMYVCDMYREVIEHPDFMPDEIKARSPLRSGDDRGRIYRIVTVDEQRPAAEQKLSELASVDLVSYLDHVNAWQRETAARLILERNEVNNMALVRRLGDCQTLPGRAHAIWLFGKLCLADVDPAKWRSVPRNLGEGSPRVSEQLIAMTDSFGKPEISSQLKPDARLRFQIALSLGSILEEQRSENFLHELASIAIQDAADPWTRLAVESSSHGCAGELLKVIIDTRKTSGSPTPDVLALVTELATLTGAEQDKSVMMPLMIEHAAMSGDLALGMAIIKGLGQGTRSKGARLGEYAKTLNNSTLDAALDGWFERSAEVARDAEVDASLRADACELLAHAAFDTAWPILSDIVRNESSQPVKMRAIAALAGYREPQVLDLFIETLNAQTPSVRATMIDAMISQPERANALLDAIEQGRVKATVLGPMQVKRLAEHKNVAIQERAKTLLASAMPADRAQALAAYQPAAEMASDAHRGKEVFKKNCATCHKLGDVGTDVGPNIGDLAKKTNAQILADILQPNRAIDNNFVSYAVVTVDGLSYNGLIIAETPSSVTMKLAENKIVPLLRENIDELYSNGVSLMPDGLEKNITQQEMADVIAFLKGWRYLGNDE